MDISILQSLFGKKKTEVEEIGYVTEAIPETAEVIEWYWVSEPYGKVVITRLPEAGGTIKYFVQEVPLKTREKKVLNKIVDVVTAEINPAEFKEENDIKNALINMTEKLIKKYEKKFRVYKKATRKKLLYYIERELLGFGPLDVLMKDYNIEDISCDGINTPVYIWHRKYESIPTNIMFTDKTFLDNFIVKLAHRSGKHVSSAFPIVDAMIYGKHRLAASFREEVSPKGSTFTIRKFREEPYSIVDLMELGTVSPEIAAYLWLLMESKSSILIIGGTAAGKTTLLNAIATLIKPGYKVVTVEETAEINLPIDNWVQFISRESYGITGNRVGEVTLFDLVKTSLRYRPDFLIVGEVRGEEAFVLFQAVATGHGGLCTIHGESLDAAIKRLTSPPMNVAESYIPLMNVAINIERVVLPKKVSVVPYGRRVTYVWEIKDFNDYTPIFEWSPSEDIFYGYIERSILLPRLSVKLGLSLDEVFEELYRRAALLRWLEDNGVRSFREVARYVSEYYVDRGKLLNRLNIEYESKPPIKREALKSIENVLPSPPPESSTSKLNMLGDVFSKVYMVLEVLVDIGKSVSKKALQERLGFKSRELDRIIDVMKKQNFISTVEKKYKRKKYIYINVKDEGLRAYHELSKSKR